MSIIDWFRNLSIPHADYQAKIQYNGSWLVQTRIGNYWVILERGKSASMESAEKAALDFIEKHKAEIDNHKADKTINL